MYLTEGGDWGNIVARIRGLKLKYNGRIPVERLSDLIEDTFTRSGAPSQKTLAVIAAELNNTALLNMFLQLVALKGQTTGLFGINVFNRFLKSGYVQQILEANQRFIDEGQKALQHLDTKLRNPAIDNVLKHEELVRVLNTYPVDDKFLKGLMHTTVSNKNNLHLFALFNKVLDELPEGHMNSEAKAILVQDTTWKRLALQTLQSPNGEVAGIVKQMMQDSGRNGIYREFINDPTFQWSIEKGLQRAKMSLRGLNPIKHGTGIGQDASNYLYNLRRSLRWDGWGPTISKWLLPG
jgi:hypothetical protein